MSLFFDGKKYLEKSYKLESTFENTIIGNCQLLFGKNTIFIPIKTKIEGKELGGVIPDGFLFDFKNADNVDFYLVEVELAKHSFYSHIFPQITKFFSFFNNPKSLAELIEKIFVLINSDKELYTQFSKHLGKKELFKALKDIIEDSQKILLVLDNKKNELPEIMTTYSDTWSKTVKAIVIKEYSCGKESIYTMDPDFETIDVSDETEEEIIDENAAYDESFHLSDVEQNVKDIFGKIKKGCKGSVLNYQKYYIALNNGKNYSYIQPRKKKIRIVITMPFEVVKKKIQHHQIIKLSEGVQRFYNAKACTIVIEDMKYIDEVLALLKANKSFKTITIR